MAIPNDLFGFDNQAQLYDAFRPDYPPSLIEFLISGLQSRNVCLDFGCGTGLFTRQLAPFFQTVIGIDVSEKQISVAQKSTNALGGFGNVSYLTHDGYDLRGILSNLNLVPEDISVVTFAQAFHWMDSDRFIAELNKVLPGVQLSLLGYSHPRVIDGRALKDDSLVSKIWKETSTVQDLPENSDVLAEIVESTYQTLLPHFQFDRETIETSYRKLNLGNLFTRADVKEVVDVKEYSAHSFQQYFRSWSPYQIFLAKYKEEIERGKFRDVIEAMGEEIVTRVMGEEKDASTDELLRNFKFHVYRTFFIWNLKN